MVIYSNQKLSLMTDYQLTKIIENEQLKESFSKTEECLFMRVHLQLFQRKFKDQMIKVRKEVGKVYK